MLANRSVRRTNLQWDQWINGIMRTLGSFLQGLLLQLLWQQAIKAYRSRKRIYATIFGQPVLSLLFASLISIITTESLSYLIRPLFQDMATWILLSFALFAIMWSVTGWSAISLWGREAQRQTLSFARKSSGYE